MSNIENNKKIAAFMGNEFIQNIYLNHEHNFPVEYSCLDSELKYDTSWDWLMPVCDKIRNIGAIDFVISLKGSVCISFDDGTVYFDMVKGGGRNTIETTYEAVINFIHWYNNNQI